MPRTVDEGFAEFLSHLKSTTIETSTAKSHRESIENCLKSNFGLQRFIRIGSFGNGTNISGYSDVDYLACLPTNQLTQNSIYSLGKVRNVLHSRFPASGVRVNSPAICISFGVYVSETTEIVPADYIRTESSFKVYEIADGQGGWMQASPDAHNAYVASVDSKLNKKVKPLIKLVKAWKYYQGVPISSFYLEMWVAKYANEEAAILYDFDLQQVLRKMADSGLAKMHDPMGFSGYISPCNTEAQKHQAISKLETAATRAGKAFASVSEGDIRSAFEWWDILYNYNFPSYYL